MEKEWLLVGVYDAVQAVDRTRARIIGDSHATPASVKLIPEFGCGLYLYRWTGSAFCLYYVAEYYVYRQECGWRWNIRRQVLDYKQAS